MDKSFKGLAIFQYARLLIMQFMYASVSPDGDYFLGFFIS